MAEKKKQQSLLHVFNPPFFVMIPCVEKVIFIYIHCRHCFEIVNQQFGELSFFRFQLFQNIYFLTSWSRISLFIANVYTCYHIRDVTNSLELTSDLYFCSTYLKWGDTSLKHTLHTYLGMYVCLPSEFWVHWMKILGKFYAIDKSKVSSFIELEGI
jgi:hypothetical protein